MHKLLAELLRELEQTELPYCVLRDGDRLDQLDRRAEIDLLVDGRWSGGWHDMLVELGFARLPGRGYYPHMFYLAYDEQSDFWLKLDVQQELAYGRPTKSIRTDLGRRCLEHRMRVAGLYRPSPEDEMVTLLLHCVLDKGRVAPERGQRLQQLISDIKDESYLEKALQTYWPAGQSLADLRLAIEQADWGAIEAEQQRVRQHILSEQRPAAAWRSGRDRFLRKANRVFGLLRPQALNVAVLAPDGAGKSTLSDGLRHNFFLPVRQVYMGLYQKGGQSLRFASVPGLRFASRYLRQWGRYLEGRYYQAKGWLVIFDRYTYDSLLPSGRALNRASRGRRWLLANACPAPDLLLFLDAPGEALYARKGEHSAAVLEKQRQDYLNLRRRLPGMVVVDANQDAEQVRREVTSIIWQRHTTHYSRN